MAERKLADVRLSLVAKPGSLTDSEVLAVLLGVHGSKEKSALQRGDHLVEGNGGLRNLFDAAHGVAFLEQHELGQAAAGARLLAAAELARRYSGQRGSGSEPLALAYLATASETLAALVENPEPEMIASAAALMRHWHGFATKVLG